LVRLAPGPDFLCLSLFLYQNSSLHLYLIRQLDVVYEQTCLIIKFAMKRCRLERQCGCFPDWVQCDNGRCIPKSSVCDRNLDCQHAGYASDDSDERDCGRTFTSSFMKNSRLVQKQTDRPTRKVAPCGSGASK